MCKDLNEIHDELALEIGRMVIEALWLKQENRRLVAQERENLRREAREPVKLRVTRCTCDYPGPDTGVDGPPGA